MHIAGKFWSKYSLHKSLKAWVVLCSCIFANPAFAIPSPELVIGSVSSLTQLFAVGFAMLSGTAAALGAKMGLKRRAGAKQSTFLINGMIVLVLLLFASFGYIFYQNSQAKQVELTRLQQTLIRPAAFSGTKIQDKNLKETSFAVQKTSELSISTDQVQKILNTLDTSVDTILLDVREDAEFSMGTMPGARHIRFPDIATSGLNLKGKKVLLMCHNGNRSSETCERLAAMGIDCRYIAGGLEKWIVEGKNFTDTTVRGLSDLRAIPAYKNKDTLISTPEFESIMSNQDIQIIDARYPKDFALNHLPNAINIPIRAMPTSDLNAALSTLQNKPTLVACYDRRSCFMGQVLGLEMSKRGIDFLGRYTTPWDYFIVTPQKPHIREWLSGRNETLWDRAINILSGWLVLLSEKVHFLFGVLFLALVSRLIVLPISLKSEKDQIVMTAHKNALQNVKDRLKDDPVRRARAVRNFHQKLGLTPLRNLTALLFLPLMMLGLSAVENSAVQTHIGFLWVPNLGAPDPLYLFPITFCILAGIYLQMTLAGTLKRRILSWGVAVPLLFAMVFQLTAASAIYLNISLTLLLVQRAYVTGALVYLKNNIQQVIRRWKIKHVYRGIIPLDYSEALKACGNKSFRLAMLKNAGFNVPQGIVVENNILVEYSTMPDLQKARLFDKIWQMIDRKTCVVRSSGSGEDGAGQSFAGVFDSVLDVDRPGLPAAFELVLKSFHSGRAHVYQGEGDVGHRGNILIQNMVDAQYSGVLFTQDPMAPGQILLEMAKGTADDLVSGRITPLSLRFGKYTHLSCDDIEAPIDITELLEIGQKVEQLMGCPQDIEWAYRGGRFFLVQSRDITTLDHGGKKERARQKEWSRLFNEFGSSTLAGSVLKQDEMSEVLPRPTPLSFSIMASLWAPGGSVDRACRGLGLNYKMPENEHGHLFQLFGKVYSDIALKSGAALHFSKTAERNLEKHCGQIEKEFHEQFLPALHEKLAYWDALDFSKISLKNQFGWVETLVRYFVDETYVTAEKINILAGFTSLAAELECNRLGLNMLHLMQQPMAHSPNQIMAKATSLPVKQREKYLMLTMGHRAMFDYELSMPRYLETPETLLKLAGANVQSLHMQNKAQLTQPPIEFPDAVVLAMRLQDLKEYAKDESLRIFAILRRVLLEIDGRLGGDDLVFYLTYEELLTCDVDNLEVRGKIAKDRLENIKLIKECAPAKAALTLHDCEILSSAVMHIDQHVGGVQGTCVSGGRDVQGKIYIACDAEDAGYEELSGFKKGDILVCRMMNPAWLPYVLQSKAVICEVGGWLSHMAIVAREHNITMIVSCSGLAGLQNGDEVKISASGKVALINVETDNKGTSAVAM